MPTNGCAKNSEATKSWNRKGSDAAKLWNDHSVPALFLVWLHRANFAGLLKP